MTRRDNVQSLMAFKLEQLFIARRQVTRTCTQARCQHEVVLGLGCHSGHGNSDLRKERLSPEQCYDASTFRRVDPAAKIAIGIRTTTSPSKCSDMTSS